MREFLIFCVLGLAVPIILFGESRGAEMTGRRGPHSSPQLSVCSFSC
jgi:hypothetical protein